MIRPICKDIFILQQKAAPATKEDQQVVVDLLDTLRANLEGCVGMAANMIGVPKAIIAVCMGPMQVAMINPVITAKRGAYETEEGCLSLTGVRACTRYEEIELEYYDAAWNKRSGRFTGFVAEVIQHECDHLEGIII